MNTNHKKRKAAMCRRQSVLRWLSLPLQSASRQLLRHSPSLPSGFFFFFFSLLSSSSLFFGCVFLRPRRTNSNRRDGQQIGAPAGPYGGGHSPIARGHGPARLCSARRRAMRRRRPPPAPSFFVVNPVPKCGPVRFFLKTKLIRAKRGGQFRSCAGTGTGPCSCCTVAGVPAGPARLPLTAWFVAAAAALFGFFLSFFFLFSFFFFFFFSFLSWWQELGKQMAGVT